VPSWIALLIAVTATAIGYGIDSGLGHKELTGVFACLYIAGCVVAVLAVRHEGLFTAVIQPPLILFCAVPGAYWLFHGGKIGSLKDLLINCGYPLIERFPLMLGAAAGVLLIGLIRWYFASSQKATATDETDDTATASAAEKSPFLRAVSSKLNALLGVASSDDDEADEEESTDSQRGPSRSSARTGRAARSGRSASGSTARGRSRHSRPSAEEEEYDPASERPRRRRQTPRDYEPSDPPRRSSRRRPRPEDDADPRGQSPREGRRDPRSGRRNPYERPAPRGSRFDEYDRYEPRVSPDSYGRYQSYESYDSYQPAAEPRRRRAPSNGSNGADSSHHPISQVRYRGSGPSDERRGEPRGERRDRSRSNGRPPADSWEYDA
jgi:hypothetical protein